MPNIFEQRPPENAVDHLRALFRIGSERESQKELKEKIHDQMEREYARSVVLLNTARVFEMMPEQNAMGIRDETGRVYLLPTFEQIWDLCLEQWKLVTEKWEQGFTQLQVTPFALPIKSLIHRVGDALIQHYWQRKLFLRGRFPGAHRFSVPLDKSAPVLWGIINPRLHHQLFYMSELSQLRHLIGVPKGEILNRQSNDALAGWKVGLIKPVAEFPDIDTAAKGESTGFKDLKGSYVRIDDYLKEMQKRRHRGESGLTVEDFLTQFLIHLQATGEVLSNSAFEQVAFLSNYMISAYQDKTMIAASWNESFAPALFLHEDTRSALFLPPTISLSMVRLNPF